MFKKALIQGKENGKKMKPHVRERECEEKQNQVWGKKNVKWNKTEKKQKEKEEKKLCAVCKWIAIAIDIGYFPRAWKHANAIMILMRNHD